jgi:hypothetical protein
MGCGTGGNELDGSTDFIIAKKINKIKTSPLPNEKLVQSRSTKSVSAPARKRMR